MEIIVKVGYNFHANNAEGSKKKLKHCAKIKMFVQTCRRIHGIFNVILNLKIKLKLQFPSNPGYDDKSHPTGFCM